ncbi:LysM peptidoglycan-binding domain-containing protein [Sporosarcina sp. ACRSL]|uniref:cell division suppressor protein YneA n=1 Tax=Sporosarcina sp. ACRSL TaxID=2918215 RepID=UPI001EF4E1B7|nr:LysM peptidoglycan-binding domain-containing protein [Sporosarcina sp. ACRSL]MCG7342954.1 LysM peptidoglycan-binding domain-containing protein [Sporosarcina sp. ACRSL]
MTFIQKYGYILLIVFLCTAFTIAGVMKEAKSTSNSFVEITISEGDTLWGLAQYHSNDEDPKRWIANVMELNDLQTTLIKSGETLKLPSNNPIFPDTMMVELAGEE